MIKYFMRRTIYKKFDRESQDMLLQLISKQYIIEIFCCMFWVIIPIFPFIPVCIIDVCEEIEFSMTTQMMLIGFMLICFVGLLVSMKIFGRVMFGFSQLLAEKIYFLVCTTKAKALCKSEFDTINQANEELYACIATQMCRGYCYSICL